MGQIWFLVFGALAANSAWAASTANFLDLNLRQNRYLGDVQHSSQESNYTVFSGDLNLETQSSGFTYKLNPVAQGSFERQEEFYFGMPEAYIQPRKIAPWFSITIGRQKRQWSRLDEEFNLGIWQPQLRWDYLAPRQQGLTGVFFDWSLSSDLRFTFFTSPIAIPDQGPNYEIKDGQFYSANRWFVQPQSRLAVFGGTKYAANAPLYWELDKPPEEDILMNSSFGFGLSYQASSPFWTHLNYAYKPLNQVHLGIECDSCATLPGGSMPLEVTALIHPRIVKHNVITWETGFDRVDDQGFVSFTLDIPNTSGFPTSYYEAPLHPTLVSGLAYQHYFQTYWGQPSWLQYSYMRTTEFRRVRGDGIAEQDDVQSSMARYPYKDLASVEWKWQISQRYARQLHWRNKYYYSVPEKGGWLTTTLNLDQGAVSWVFGADVLGSDVDSNSKEAGLFTRYRANDRVFGGVSYVF